MVRKPALGVPSELAPWFARWGSRGISAHALVYGALTVVGGPGRWSGRGLAAARVIPGGAYTWGSSLALAGLLALVGAVLLRDRRVMLVGFTVIGTWHTFYGASMVISAVSDDQAGLAGPSTYLLLAVLTAMSVQLTRATAPAGDGR